MVQTEQTLNTNQKAMKNKLGQRKHHYRLASGYSQEPPLHISVSKLMEIETECVYTDEVDISLGFAEFVRVGITQTACQHSKKTPKDSTLHHIDEQLHRTLREGSTCSRQQQQWPGSPRHWRHRGKAAQSPQQRRCKEILCAHWVQQNRCQQGARSWDARVG